MKLWTKEHQESYENAKLKKEKFENKYLKDKKYLRVRDHCHYTEEYRSAEHSIFNLKYIVPKTIPIVYHIIIKKLAEESKK